MTEPRRDRWVRLYDLGLLLQKRNSRLADVGRRRLRQYAQRVVKEYEDMHDCRISKLWRGRMYVNVSAIDELVPPDEQVIGGLERAQVDLNAKVRHLERQQNAHGARIRNLEKLQQLTSKYLSDVAGIK